jgi:MutS domain V
MLRPILGHSAALSARLYDDDVTVDDVLIQYQNRLHELQTGLHQLRLPHALTALVLAMTLVLVFTLSLSAIRGQISFLWPPLPVLAAGASARRLQQNRRARSRMWRLKLFYARAVERVKGNWARSGATGEEFDDPDHVYTADLHVFGEGSLFELLCIARTSIGKRGLANYLLTAPALEETLLRQEAVRELTGRLDVREKIATLGEFEFAESKWSTFEDWLNSPKLSFTRSLPILALVTSALLAALVLAGFDHLIPWTPVRVWIGILIAIHALVGLAFRVRVNTTLASIRPVCGETRVLRDGLALLATAQFQSVKLRKLSEQVRNGAPALRKLEWLLGGLTQRDKEWFYLPSRVLLVGTQLCIAIEQWRSQHGDAMRTWLEAWAEFEALSALAAYGYENPANTFPAFADSGPCFEARDLGHPLLSHSACVVNDVELTRTAPFYVISGSNMSGKSTLLRAIGLNAVLAFAGAPVRAADLRLSGLSIFASLSIVDSLLNGKSKFLAEVDRLRLAIEAAANTPVLFLVDEIFAGTNSRDRRIAAEAVVRTLVDRGAIGALSTHDLALTEIVTAEGMCGANVHMGSRDGRDPMDFDYRLKPGVTQESNALAIARMAGVPV